MHSRATQEGAILESISEDERVAKREPATVDLSCLEYNGLAQATLVACSGWPCADGRCRLIALYAPHQPACAWACMRSCAAACASYAAMQLHLTALHASTALQTHPAANGDVAASSV